MKTKLLKYLLILPFLTCVGVMTHAQSIKIISDTNVESKFELNDVRSISFQDDVINFNFINGDINSFTLAEIQKIFFDDLTNDLNVSEIANFTKIFPNPVQDVLNINVSGDNSNWPINIVVRAIDGKLIYSSQLNEQTGTFQVNTSNWPNGIYLLLLDNGANKQIEKIIKK